MGQALAETSVEARNAYATADAALGESISALAFAGPDDQLNLTVNSQPAILATSIAYVRAAEESAAALSQAAFYAGHSMGQYSAMVAAGVISLADGVRLVRERGRLMQSAPDGAMAAVLGLDEARIPELVAAAQEAGVFTVANRNSPGQIVVSGERAAIELASEKAKELGAKRAIMLPVSVAAHSPLMAAAAQGMREVLATVQFSGPVAPLLANADARLLTTGEECRAELVEHLTLGVDWIAAIETLLDKGVTHFIEVGPGKVLSGLVKRIAPDVEMHSLDEPTAPDRLALPSFLTASGATASGAIA
jgi:[acyl-carrier-protein] S-malonyltransferase